MYTCDAIEFLIVHMDATSHNCDKIECGDWKMDQFGCNIQRGDELVAGKCFSIDLVLNCNNPFSVLLLVVYCCINLHCKNHRYTG